MSFQEHLNILESENFSLKIDRALEFCECLLFSSFTATNKTKCSFKKYPKESLKKIVKENSSYAEKCLVFGILDILLFTHAL